MELKNSEYAFLEDANLLPQVEPIWAQDVLKEESDGEIGCVSDEVGAHSLSTFLQTGGALGISLTEGKEDDRDLIKPHSAETPSNEALIYHSEDSLVASRKMDSEDFTSLPDTHKKSPNNNFERSMTTPDHCMSSCSQAVDRNKPTDSCVSSGAISQRKHSSEEVTPSITVHNNVYVSELPPHWNTEKLRSVCSTYGNIISAKVARDALTNKSREYGFVMFETEEQATACVNTLKGRVVEGRILVCRYAHEKAMPYFAQADQLTHGGSALNTPSESFLHTPKKSASESPFTRDMSISNHFSKSSSVNFIDQHGSPGVLKSCNVFIQGFPLHWNTDKLRSLCGSYGKVQLAKIVRDAATSISSGHGFVLFEKEEQAALCVSALNHSVIEERILTCRLAREKASTSPASSTSHHPGGSATSLPVGPWLMPDGNVFTPPLTALPPPPPPPPPAPLSPPSASPANFVEAVSFMPVHPYKVPVQQNVPTAVPYMTPVTFVAPPGGAVQTACPVQGFPFPVLMTKQEKAVPPQVELRSSLVNGQLVGSSPSYMTTVPGQYVAALPHYSRN